jgi:quercetin dioxygenase-like cupin family protein
MEHGAESPIESAEVVVPCAELGDTLAFFVDRLGFRLDAIFPADAPLVAIVSGHGVRLRLQRDAEGAPPVIRLRCRDLAAVARGGATELIAPSGARVQLEPIEPTLVLPPLRPAFALTRAGSESAWGVGRAGMQYRDLIPDRQGGRVIASHIRIPLGGAVADSVHWHDIRFQLIYCHRGWVKLVYEDQGAPFVMRAGDCVLQPPQIRHRVLECSEGLEVIEITSPAEHRTVIDHELALPTAALRSDRSFGGQRFARHEVAVAIWTPGPLEGFESRDLGIAAATGGLVAARVSRRAGGVAASVWTHGAELMFAFVLAGSLTLRCEGAGAHALAPGDAFVVPAGVRYALDERSSDLQLLAVMSPADSAVVRDPSLSPRDLA